MKKLKQFIKRWKEFSKECELEHKRKLVAEEKYIQECRRRGRILFRDEHNFY